jgi:hypothetical protein
MGVVHPASQLHHIYDLYCDSHSRFCVDKIMEYKSDLL